MDNAKLHGLLRNMAAVLGHMTALPAGMVHASTVAQIRADIDALSRDLSGDQDETASLMDRVAALERWASEMHGELATKAPKAVQAAVADVEPVTPADAS